MRQAIENKALTAIVTGASTGIGYAVAKRLLEDGVNVVLAARTESDLVKASEELSGIGNVRHVVGDVAERQTGERLMAKAVEDFGGVDILVNNAGVFNPKPFLETGRIRSRSLFLRSTSRAAILQRKPLFQK